MLSIFCLVLLVGEPCAAEDVESLMRDAEAHYHLREQESELPKAIETYRRVLEIDPENYEGAWKLAKAYWYQGNYSSGEKLPFFEKGIEAGRKAIQNAPDRCEGHFWLGINLAVLAESSSVFRALGMVDDVKTEIQKAMEISENCECGGPQRVLGKLHARLPFFKGGSKTKAIEFLKKSLQLCPQDTQSRIFLAEIYIDEGKNGFAKQLLRQVLVQEPDPQWIPETKQNKIVAEKMLRDLQKGR
ncbi:tetratricopeptide repeat protein [bacterium]|nr:tetratricopeptide repeat protein [bacterium]MCI0606095.1 tetratricopeptide repeat protein [bacterium]